jgi:hypothetical protein
MYMTSTLEACFKTAETTAEASSFDRAFSHDFSYLGLFQKDLAARESELAEEESDLAEQRARLEAERNLEFYEELSTDKVFDSSTCSKYRLLTCECSLRLLRHP